MSENLIPVEGNDKLAYGINDTAAGVFQAGRVMEMIGIRIVEYRLNYNRRRGTNTPLLQTDILPAFSSGPGHYLYMFGEPGNQGDVDYGLPLWIESPVRRILTRIAQKAVLLDPDAAEVKKKVRSVNPDEDATRVREILEAQVIKGTPKFPIRQLDNGIVRISVQRPRNFRTEQLVGLEFRSITGRDTRDAHGKVVLLRNP
jgi:hypothetical protein